MKGRWSGVEWRVGTWRGGQWTGMVVVGGGCVRGWVCV